MGQRRSKQQSPFRRNELWLCEEAVPEEPREPLEPVDQSGASLGRRNLPRPSRLKPDECTGAHPTDRLGTSPQSWHLTTDYGSGMVLPWSP